MRKLWKVRDLERMKIIIDKNQNCDKRDLFATAYLDN